MTEARDILRIVLADDHPIVREGLRQLVNAQPDMRVVGEAADGEAAVRQARELSPDVLIMDLSIPKLGGAEATEIVRRECPGVRVLALTVHEEAAYVRRLLEAGAGGYVLKRAAPEELVRAVRSVAAGGRYVDPAVTSALLDGLLRPRTDDGAPRREALSEREREVLVGIARGYSNKEIAAQRAISVKTVETYKARLMEKLGLRGRVDIVRYAADQGWLSGP